MQNNSQSQPLALYALGIGLCLGWLIGHSLRIVGDPFSDDAKVDGFLDAFENYDQLYRKHADRGKELTELRERLWEVDPHWMKNRASRLLPFEKPLDERAKESENRKTSDE